MTPQEIQSSIEAIINGLTPLVQKLQVPLEKLFEYAIRQNYVYAISNLVEFSLGLILICILLKIAIIWNKKVDEYDNGSPYLIVIIPSIAYVVLLFTNIQEIIARFVNPEYMALQDLFKLIIK